ncbi:GNAT family N-acetyltransferase [Bacillus sp. SM2101]|uniref:GNAT family N-acetyltransferase n=1 Tax=Bacillus sp. SM2101 TaxID=2805366 RepID=UPI001BDE2C9C
MFSKYALNLTIKKLTRKHENEAKEMILDGLAERFGFLDRSLNPDLTNIIEAYTNVGSVFLIGCYENFLCCTGALIKENEETCRIVRMSVHKSYRGRGLARKMINELEGYARQFGYKKIVLETDNDWISAMNLYKSSNYMIEYIEEGCTHFYKRLCS